MRFVIRGVAPAVAPLALLAAACASVPKEALTFAPTPKVVRELEGRRYSGVDDAKLVAGAAGALQAMGYTLEQTEASLGLVVGSKKRTAEIRRHKEEAVMGSMMSGRLNAVEKEQVVRASVTVVAQEPARPSSRVVRITFQRIIWDTRNEIAAREAIVEPQVYSDFFDRLSKAVSAEGRTI